MDQKDNKTTCMACSCPCDPFNLVQGRPEQGRMGEMHKEHNHPIEEKHEEAKTCSACGHEHKQDGRCDCGCK